MELIFKMLFKTLLLSLSVAPTLSGMIYGMHTRSGGRCQHLFFQSKHESLQIHRGKHMTPSVQQHLALTPFCDPRTKLRGKTNCTNRPERCAAGELFQGLEPMRPVDKPALVQR